MTATSYGLQPIKLVILQNKEIQHRLVEHSWEQQQVAQASHVLILCIQTNLSEVDVENYFKKVKAIRNTPDEIITPFKDYLKESIKK